MKADIAIVPSLKVNHIVLNERSQKTVNDSYRFKHSKNRSQKSNQVKKIGR